MNLHITISGSGKGYRENGEVGVEPGQPRGLEWGWCSGESTAG